MEKEKFKYLINHHLSKLPREIAIGHVEKSLLKQFKISRSVFYSDRNIGYDSKSSIPSDRLDAYAILFGCTPEELKNYKMKGKSLIEKFHKIKAGLK